MTAEPGRLRRKDEEAEIAGRAKLFQTRQQSAQSTRREVLERVPVLIAYALAYALIYVLLWLMVSP